MSVSACAAVLAAPAPTPHGDVLDLVGAPEPAIGVSASREPAVGVVSGPQPEATAGHQTARDLPPAPAIADVPGPTAPPVESLEGYRWPIAHPRLTNDFGPTPWGSWVVGGEGFHDGIDLATFCGDRVTAAHAGTVLAAGRQFDDHLGWVGSLDSYYQRLDRKKLWSSLPIVVVIDDGNGYRSVYAHFGRIVARKGELVEAGDLLGYEGATGHASGCHLHYGLFSPWERDTLTMRRDIVKRMKLPGVEIARIDPLLVLPPKKGIP